MNKIAITVTYCVALASIAASHFTGDITALGCIVSVCLTTMLTEVILWITD